MISCIGLPRSVDTRQLSRGRNVEIKENFLLQEMKAIEATRRAGLRIQRPCRETL